MNRKIKFRAIDGTRMLYLDDFGAFVLRGKFAECLQGEIYTEEYPLMQFTGMTGKGEVDIYDKDILSKKWKCKVYQDIKGTWMVRFNTNPEVNHCEPLHDYLRKRKKAGALEDTEVIGNAYQNPDLLK